MFVYTLFTPCGLLVIQPGHDSVLQDFIICDSFTRNVLLAVPGGCHECSWMTIKLGEWVQHWRERDGNTFIDQIVTGDETWVSHNTPTSKQQSWSGFTFSHHRSHASSNKLHHFKKLMASVFWDSKGVLLVDFMPSNTTINSDALLCYPWMSLSDYSELPKRQALVWNCSVAWQCKSAYSPEDTSLAVWAIPLGHLREFSVQFGPGTIGLSPVSKNEGAPCW